MNININKYNKNNMSSDLPKEIPSSKKKIFTNCFSLNIENEKIQAKCEGEIEGKIKIMIFYLLFITVILIVGLVGAFLIQVPVNIKPPDVDIPTVKYLGYTCCPFIFISYVLLIFKVKFATVNYALLYFNLVNINLISFYFIVYMKAFLGDIFHQYDFLTYSIYFSVTISYIFFVDSHFIRIFLSNITLVVIYIVGTYAYQTTFRFHSFVNMFLSYILNLVLYYYYSVTSKTLFYYKEKIELQKNWVYDILNNWNSGVIIYNVKKQKVKFCNDFLKKYEQFKGYPNEKLASINSVNDCSSTSNLRNHYDLEETVIRKNEANEPYKKVDDLKLIKKILCDYNPFNKLYDINPDLPPRLIECFSNKRLNFNEIIEVISQTFPVDTETNTYDHIFFKEFIYLGHISLMHENCLCENKIFEFYIHGLNSYKGIYYEFMINDVTTTKKLEENRLKEKATILGKIGHEFKNPIIVVEEVIEQIIEQDKISEQSLRQMNFIKNLCQYLIILVKDFEVVANIENNKESDVFFESFNLKDFIFNEIKDIVNTLIKKKTENIGGLVDLVINIENGITKIMTDSIRLKQILINLLSNAVKFVYEGTLEISIEKTLQDTIRFYIIDSGKGISNDIIDCINSDETTTIQKENSCQNKLGTGYGLNIVQNLCKLLMSKLNVKKNEPSGTIFYFDIPIGPIINNTNNVNNENENSLKTMSNAVDVEILSNKTFSENDLSENKNLMKYNRSQESIIVANILNDRINTSPGVDNKLDQLQNSKSKLIFDKYTQEYLFDINNDEINKSYDSLNLGYNLNLNKLQKSKSPLQSLKQERLNTQKDSNIKKIPDKVNANKLETKKQVFELKLPNCFTTKKDIVNTNVNFKFINKI